MQELYDAEDACDSCGAPRWACELAHCTGLTPMCADEYDPDPEDAE